MNETELANIKNRIHEQRCSCYYLASTVQKMAESMEDKGAEEARLYYGLASFLKDIGGNLEKIIVDLEWKDV